MSEDTAVDPAPGAEAVGEALAGSGAEVPSATGDQQGLEVPPVASGSSSDNPPSPPGPPPQGSGPESAEDADVPIVPDSLRIDERVAEELFGALYTGITTHGPSAFGNNNTIITHLGLPSPKPIIGKLPFVLELMEVYVESGADAELDALLSRRSTGCLTGRKSTGRFSTACAALARRHSPDLLYEISLPTGTLPEALVTQADELIEHCGYVLRLSGRGHVDAMRKLADLFRQRSASLVLIKDVEARESEPRDAEVRHQQPDPIGVFRQHLALRLRLDRGVQASEAAQAAQTYLRNDGLQNELKLVYGPKESVALAKAVAKGHPVDDATLEDVLAASQPRRRVRAGAILLPPHDAPITPRRRAGQHERAFRIAYAVFHLQPLHYVFEAASWLLEEIDDAALRPEWGRMALQHPVQDLLGEEFQKDWAEGRDARKAALGASRVAWIRDGGLRGAILDVAWHDFDSTRHSLLKWLDRLVLEGDEVMKRAAAETAALLVHHDFHRVHLELVDGWAASRKPGVRQAAAWTETIADLTGDVRHLVRGKVAHWCAGTNYQRDTAARLYASGLQQPVPAWSMADLRRIAEDKMQRPFHAVAEGVNQLYQPARARWLIGELAGWCSRPQVRLHAARALIALASRLSADPADERPELLVRLVADEVSVTDLAVVWRAALMEPEVAPQSRPVLSRWLRQADVDSSLRGPAIDLLRSLAVRPAMGRRVRFHLLRTAEFRDGFPGWLSQELEH